MTTDEERAPEPRSECPIVRTHRRFLLRQLEFTQQYAAMYGSRMSAQRDRAVAAIMRAVSAEDGEVGGELPSDVLRVLEMKPGEPAFSVGVVYKQMKLLPRFLAEYQRELVRIDAGDNNDEDGGGDDAAAAAEVDAAPIVDSEDGLLESGQERAAADEHFSVCHGQDELMLEDSSGRVTLQGLKATHFCTGVVVGIYGTLMPNGQVLVHRYAFADARELYVPRPLVSAVVVKEPCYIAFVCGLNVTLPENLVDCALASGPSAGEAGDHAANHVPLVRHRALLELLVDFIGGTTNDPALLAKSRRISRLVIGGNSIAATDEQRLKKKVKLDPSDHVRLNDDKSNFGVVTSAKLMRELDSVLERLVAAVEVELMPGDNDMSDAFQPQQPLHPVLLPNAARYSSLRLVSNPFEFTAAVDDDAAAKKEDMERNGAEFVKAKDAVPSLINGVNVFVTSGQNVNDVARQTKFENHLEAMSMILASGCACPTAPNTLFSYPFRTVDPFLFPRTPHCFVACDQPRFETRYASLDALQTECSRFLEKHTKDENEEGSDKDEMEPDRVAAAAAAAAAAGRPGTRIVCVPSFARSGTVVLVDVHSPTLEATRVTFAMRGLDDQ